MSSNQYTALGDPAGQQPESEFYNSDSDIGFLQQQTSSTPPTSLLYQSASLPAQSVAVNNEPTHPPGTKALPPVGGKMQANQLASHTMQMPEPRMEYTDSNPLGDDGGANPLGSADRPTVRFWHISYYSKYFDIDTKELMRRIAFSLFPNNKFNDIVTSRVELYGPFWIPVTLSLAIFVASSFQKFAATITSASQNQDYDVILLGKSFTTVSVYTIFAPLLLFIYSKYISKAVSIYELVCVYSYSMSLWVPVFILCAIPSNMLRWLLVITALFLSTFFIWKSVSSMFSTTPGSPSQVVGLKYWIPIVSSAVAHISYILAIKFIFFPYIEAPSSSKPK